MTMKQELVMEIVQVRISFIYYQGVKILAGICFGKTIFAGIFYFNGFGNWNFFASS